MLRVSPARVRQWRDGGSRRGRLKVKKEAVGIPPRTRLVRLSDVAAIRPIVDPTAAITGEVRKLDLPSIPRQQLQIMEDHQKLLIAESPGVSRNGGADHRTDLRAQLSLSDLDTPGSANSLARHTTKLAS